MKWVALALIIVAMPLFALWLRGNPKQAPWLWGCLTFLPFVIGPWNLDVNPYATPFWSGYVKGWEVSVLDSVALAVILGTRGRWPKVVLLLPFLAYLLAVIISVLQAKFPNYAIAYVIQLLRVGLVFLAIARVASAERGERALLTGLVVGLTVQAGYALWYWAGGALQTGGSLGHQNLLGFVSHMVVFPAFALLLSGRWKKLAFVGLLAGAIAVTLTASRATIALAGLGIILTLLISVALRFNGRKVAVGVFGLVLMIVSLPIAFSNLDRRFAVQKSDMSFFEPDDQRLAFNRAALDMIAREPFGVGPNHYVFIANTEGYSKRAGVDWSTGNRSANVHNAYLLITAESGYFGAFTFVVLLLAAIQYAFLTAIKYRRNANSDVLIGLGVAILILSIHSFVESVAVLSPSQYLLAATLGLISGVRSRLEAERAKVTGSRRSNSSGEAVRELNQSFV